MIAMIGFLIVFALDNMICAPMMFLSKKHDFRWMLAYYLIIIFYCVISISSTLIYYACQ